MTMSTMPIDLPLKSSYRAAEKALFFAAYDRLESVGDAAQNSACTGRRATAGWWRLASTPDAAE
jgi:hypothetical protein